MQKKHQLKGKNHWDVCIGGDEYRLFIRNVNQEKCFLTMSIKWAFNRFFFKNGTVKQLVNFDQKIAKAKVNTTNTHFSIYFTNRIDFSTTKCYWIVNTLKKNDLVKKNNHIHTTFTNTQALIVSVSHHITSHL